MDRRLITRRNIPDNLLILSFSRLNLQTLVVHLMHISRRLHITQNVVLQLGYWLQGVTHILVLLDITNHLSGLRSLGEVDEISLLDDGGDAVFDEGQIGQIYTCGELVMLQLILRVGMTYRRRERMEGWPHGAVLCTRQSSWCWPWSYA